MMALCLLAGGLWTVTGVLAADIDVDAAKALAKKNNCFKCHAIDKTKKGPAYRDIAFKFKGKPDAEEKIIEHFTVDNEVILEDCSTDDHKIIETKDKAAIKNLVAWILSLPDGVARVSSKDRCKKG